MVIQPGLGYMGIAVGTPMIFRPSNTYRTLATTFYMYLCTPFAS